MLKQHPEHSSILLTLNIIFISFLLQQQKKSPRYLELAQTRNKRAFKGCKSW